MFVVLYFSGWHPEKYYTRCLLALWKISKNKVSKFQEHKEEFLMYELLLLLTLKICQKIKVSEFQVQKKELSDQYWLPELLLFLTLKNMPKNQGEWILSAEGRAQTNFFSLYLLDFENVQNLTTNKHLLFLTLKYWVSEQLLFLT